MEISFLLRGLLIGLSIAAVVGPMSVLCMQRTLHRGFRYGIISGLGIASADAIYGSLAAFGLTIITSFLVQQHLWIRLIGGLFLLYLGIRSLLTPPAERAAKDERTTSTGGFIAGYGSTLMLTLTNPMTILSFAAIFAGIGVGSSKNNVVSASLVVCGVFLGSALWWFLLTGGISLFRHAISSIWLLWINRISGGVIAIFGLLALLSLRS